MTQSPSIPEKILLFLPQHALFLALGQGLGNFHRSSPRIMRVADIQAFGLARGVAEEECGSLALGNFAVMKHFGGIDDDDCARRTRTGFPV